MDIVKILKAADLFSDIGEDDLKAIAAMGNFKKVSQGEMIFAEGSGGDEFCIVAKGAIAINKNVAGGRKRNLSNLGPGEVFGEISLFDREPRSADVEAIEDSEVVVLPNTPFLDLLAEKPALAAAIQRKVIHVLCKRLRATGDMLKEGVIWGFSMEA